jgi:hypothetical protein
MALNQTIISPLTNIEGSISSFTSSSRNTIQIDPSFLPSYEKTGWQYKILTNPVTTTSTAQVNVTGLRLTLANSKKYIINGYLLGSTVSAGFGLRLGIESVANTEVYYTIETPTGTTAILLVNKITAVAGSLPGAGLTNYCLIQVRAIVITPASGVSTFTPTFSSENAANTVALGPSVIYYREY